MNQYDALISALKETDKLLDNEGLSYDIVSELLRQRNTLIQSISNLTVGK